jgi:hypothetical protein
LADFVELIIEQGATFSTEVSITDANGDGKNLLDYVVRSQIRKSYYSTSVINFEIFVDSPSDGLITMEISAANTANINPGRYVYDTVIEQTSTGIVTRIFEGIVTVLPSVTR